MRIGFISKVVIFILRHCEVFQFLLKGIYVRSKRYYPVGIESFLDILHLVPTHVGETQKNSVILHYKLCFWIYIIISDVSLYFLIVSATPEELQELIIGIVVSLNQLNPVFAYGNIPANESNFRQMLCSILAYSHYLFP